MMVVIYIKRIPNRNSPLAVLRSASRVIGIITQARIREDLKDKERLDWITALRASASNQ